MDKVNGSDQESDTNTMVIVFSFPRPKEDITTGIIIKKAKELFADKPDIKVHMAVNDAANDIMSILVPDSK